MAGYVNKAIVMGRLGKDPDVRTFQSGGRVCNLSVATTKYWRDKQSGDRRERTEWHRVVIRNEGLIGIAEKYLKKGSAVYLEGQIETRKFEKNGSEQYTTEIVLKGYGGALVLVDSKSSSNSGSSDGDSYSRSDQGTGYSSSRPAGDPDLDDEIPF